jgi:hypothetical protein
MGRLQFRCAAAEARDWCTRRCEGAKALSISGELFMVPGCPAGKWSLRWISLILLHAVLKSFPLAETTDQKDEK